jgi:hypothetical protein
MTSDVIRMLLGLAGIALIVAIGKVALVPSARLGVGVFRPYRGDPWPVGVQEDDDARFSWPRPPSRPPAGHGDDHGSPDHIALRPVEPEQATSGFEEIPPVDLAVQPLTSRGVHRARR